MADEPKKIIVDDDWKAEARREKERLEQETQVQPGRAPLINPSFGELVNLLVMQALGGLGMLAAPGGERIPPNLEVAKYFVDMLQVLEDKTKNNVSADEQKLLEQVLYDLRMRYVQLASAGAAGGPRGGITPPGTAT